MDRFLLVVLAKYNVRRVALMLAVFVCLLFGFIVFVVS